MRIGFVTEYFPPFVVGGAELSAYELAKNLCAAGHSVDVITPNYGASAREEMERINVFRVAYPQKLTTGEQVKSFFSHNIFMHLYMTLSIMRIAKKRNLDILHAQNTNSIIPTFLAARLLGLKFVLSLRDFKSLTNGSVLWLQKDIKPVPGYGFKSYLQNEMKFCSFFMPDAGIVAKLKYFLDILYRWPDLKIRQKCIRCADAIITVSGKVRSLYIQNGFADISHRMFTVFNIFPRLSAGEVDERMLRRVYNIPRGKKIVLWSGRRTPAKGFDIFLKAAAIISARFDEVCFVLTGRGAPVQEKLPVSDLGMILNSEVIKIMSISAVVAVPSRWNEPLSRVIVESMSLGVPVVATDAGGTPEMITSGENGYLVKPGDADELADRIGDILGNFSLASEMSEKAKKYSGEMFSPEKIVPEIIRIYGNDVKERKRLSVEVLKV